MSDSDRVTIVIPAFNEERTIASVVSAVRGWGYEAVVVDDGCTDRTAQMAAEAGATVVAHPRNLGYDAALATGLVHAAGRADVVVTLDADAQHDPAYIAQLVSPLRAGQADVSVGVRSRLPRRTERAFARHGRRRHGIADPLSGMKALRASLVLAHRDALGGRSIGSGLVIACQRDGARIAAVAVPVRERADRSRFGSGMRAEWRIGLALIRCAVTDHSHRRAR